MIMMIENKFIKKQNYIIIEQKRFVGKIWGGFYFI
jgi:hypothetical protein